MSNTWLEFGKGTVFVFLAGAFWQLIRSELHKLHENQARQHAELRRDMNGIGDKLKQVELKQFYVAMMLCKDDQTRQEVLNALVRKLT